MVFGRFPLTFRFYTINEAHKQYSVLDIIFNYIFDFGPPGKHPQQVRKTYYMSVGFAGRHAVGAGDLSIHVFLEVQNKRYSQISYLVDYIAYGLHL